MALIKCSECGKEISDKAAACVHCGCPVSVSTPKSSEPIDFQKTFGEFFNDSTRFVKERGITVDFDANVSGTEKGSTPHSIFLKELGRAIEFSVPNNIQVGQAIRVQLKDDANYNFVCFNVVSVSKAATASSTSPATAPTSDKTVSTAAYDEGASCDQKIKRFKTNTYRPFVICMIAFALCVISLVIAKTTSFKAIAILFFVAFFPAIFGVCRIPYYIKVNKAIKRLEARNLLAKAVTEMESDKVVSFGDKALLSEHFLFTQKRNGIVIACDDILWVYSLRANKYYSLKIGTKTLPITSLSGVSIFTRDYKNVLQQAIKELQNRNPDVIVNNTPENRKKYQNCRNQVQ